MKHTRTDVPLRDNKRRYLLCSDGSVSGLWTSAVTSVSLILALSEIYDFKTSGLCIINELGLF